MFVLYNNRLRSNFGACIRRQISSIVVRCFNSSEYSSLNSVNWKRKQCTSSIEEIDLPLIIYFQIVIIDKTRVTAKLNRFLIMSD